ncbi:MAG: signal peptidase I [Verrucomicrobia bacterium]|nr:signal peptidase I [Verrucomicrobiota bacterium]
MFGLFQSQEKKMRENAANWLELADRVYHFRRDVLPAAQVAELQSHMAALRSLLKEKAGAEKLKLEIEALEEVLRRTGGAVYPKSALVENVEFFLVAAIVILGIRTYFVQPFKIPTNSMWPTYNGMTAEVFPTAAEEPSTLVEAGRAVAFGAWPHRLDAPVAGEVLIPFMEVERGPVYNRKVPGRTWLVIPTELREYTLIVGDKPVSVKLPLDFDFNWVISEGLVTPGRRYDNLTFVTQLLELGRRNGVVERTINGERVRCIRTGRTVRAGERFLSFDELTGDQLFVDRVSYHFVRPDVGQGFVFRTDHIDSIYMRDGAGNQLEQYYIKRLVGTPGDELEIVAGKATADGNLSAGSAHSGGVLLRNGKPIEGAGAFASNRDQKDGYRGYQSIGELAPGKKLTVPKGRFLALGDNSFNSQDGRYWGFVPGKDVAVRPLFIYFPFTKHWGPAK